MMEGAAITSYVATSSPGGIRGTVSGPGSGEITVTGLTNGVDYTFTVTAVNEKGTSAPSSASNSVTPKCCRWRSSSRRSCLLCSANANRFRW